MTTGEAQTAGEGISDEEMVKEVAGQTSPDLKVEDVFERESDGADSTKEAATADADDIEG